MARSLKIQPHYIPNVKSALKLSAYSTQRALAQQLGFALVTVSRFVNGQAVDSATFKSICQELQLDWQKLADLSTAEREATVALSAPSLPPTMDWECCCHATPFFGRQPELATITHWVQDRNCQIISMVGSGGIGKTALAHHCIQALHETFEFCIWRSLVAAPFLSEVLTDILLTYEPQFAIETADRPEKLWAAFLDFLGAHRCWIVFDNLESILQSESRLGSYRSGYEPYGQFLELMATANHQSCILLTTREPLPDLALREGGNSKARVLQLWGLAHPEAQKIFQQQGEFQGNSEDWQRLLSMYAGNPLALKIAAVGIQEIFNGNLHQFLISTHQKPWSFDAIEQLLNQQIDRLSESEQEVLYWLAIKHEPVQLDTLSSRILTPDTRSKIPEILRSLVGRGLTEKSGLQYALQPLISEHVQQRLLQNLCQEFSQGQRQILNRYALLEAETKDFIREMQMRKLVAPWADQLLHDLGGQSLVQAQIQVLLQDFQSAGTTGYGPGNLINLMGYLGIELSGKDFSQLPLWQADLRSVSLRGVNFSHTDLSQAIFHENLGICTAVAFSADRRFLAAGDTNGEIHIWQLANRRKILTIAAHSSWIWSLAFSPDQQTLASGGDDQVIKIWDRETGHCRNILQGHQGKIWDLAYAEAGQQLVSASDHLQFKQWDLQDGSCLKTWEFPPLDSSVRAIAIHDNLLAIGSEDHRVRVWSVGTLEPIAILDGHRDWIRSLAFDPTGEILVSSSEDGELRVWHWREQTLLHILEGHRKRIVCLAISPDGRLLASGSEDMILKIWDLERGQCLQTIHGHQSFIWALAFSADSRILASGSGDYSVRLWQAKTGKCYYKFQGYSSWSPALAIDSQGSRIISGNDDGTIQRWQLTDESEPQILGRHPQRVCALAISPDDRLLASGGEEGLIQLWDLETDRCIRSWQAHQTSVWSLAFSPTHSHLASSGEDGAICIWELEHQRCLQRWQDHRKWVAAIAYTADGQTLISGSHDHSIKVWDVQQCYCRQTLLGHQGWIWKLVLSPDSQLIASCSIDQTIKLWQLETGECLGTFMGHNDTIWSLAFSPDGRQLASASSDLTVKIWEISTGQCVQTFLGARSSVGTVLFSPRGDQLFSTNQDETIKVWDLPSGQLRHRLSMIKPYSGMNIQGVQGLTLHQQQTLYKLGAV